MPTAARHTGERLRRGLPAALGVGVVLALVLNSSTSQDVYADLSGGVASAPHWIQVLVEVTSEGGLVLLACLFVVVASFRWRTTRSLLMPATTGLSVLAAYGISEWLKALHTAPRPCWADSAARIAAECPPAGDWSLPSNHAAIAAALGAAVVVLAPRLWPLVLALVTAVGAARVALGVHYPHDVLDGFTVGAGVVFAVHLSVVLAGRRSPRRSGDRHTSKGAARWRG